MGAAMARRLVQAQFHVVGYDLNAASVTALEQAGGHGAASAKEAARSADALVLMVVNADQVDAVLFADGALEALAPGAHVIVMATCAPARIAALAGAIAATGRHLIDAPVSGGVVGAQAGTLSIMAAAPKATFEDARPILTAMGSNLYHLGETAGQGAAMKIVNQLLAGVHLAAAAEGLAFAERAGIDPKVALEIVSGSAASSWMLRDRGPRMVADTGAVTSAVDIFVKDLGLVLAAGTSAKAGLPLAAAAHQLFLAASGMGLGAHDDSQVIAPYRVLAKPAT
jgi:L-threonate 2-dehydrogenase